MTEETYAAQQERKFSEAFHELPQPVLAEQGFRRVLPPRGWFAPAKLFESQNRWFGASWDWRDRVLDVDLGRLFQYHDVFPRVIIQGPMKHFRVASSEQAVDEFVVRQLSEVAALLPAALESFDAKLDESLREARTLPTGSNKKTRRIFAEHLSRIDKPLRIAEWTGCRIIGRRRWWWPF